MFPKIVMQHWNEIAIKHGISDKSEDLARILDEQSATFRQEFLIPSIGTVIYPNTAKSTAHHEMTLNICRNMFKRISQW